jgi:undecaprenyl-diphosphatase
METAGASPLLDQLFTTLLLGLIQGVTEWLPISSTAHLKLAETLLGLATTPLFNLLLHLGTMTVVIFYFRKDVAKILAALFHADFKSESGMLIPRMVVATIPTAVVGLSYSIFLQDSMETIPIIAVTFILGATVVYTTKFAKEDVDGLSYKIVLLMGLAQGFAIFPGLSRSGVTISIALLLGLKRQKAFKFSFLLSIPAIIGDFAFEAYTQRGALSASGINLLEAAGALAVAMVAGYFAIKLVSNVIRSRKFHYFAFYTWTLGFALLLLSLIL